MIKICNDRSVFPNSVKISNQYENDTRSIVFDLSDVQFTGNTYLICKYQGQSTFYAPLLLDENNSIFVETFLSAQPGAYTCVIVISTVTIDADYNFSSDNPLFVSNEFTLNVDPNFLTGTATAWQLTPAAQNYFDQLIALVDKVQEDLDSGAFVGNGIKSITLISTVGLVDTYQILFTNGSTFDFQVTNGATPTITIQDGVWFVNGVSTGVSALGQKGDKGDPGVGIVSIEKTSTSGNVDTYTITFTNQTTSTFTVTNGTDGKDGVTPNIQIGTVDTLPAGSQATATITGTTENPLLNLGIPQGETGGTTNYNDLENKPQINGVELSGNQSGNDIGLVNNQQGIENSGKVLGIGQDGLVVPVKNAGASDNIIYKDVAKSLNPNVADSFKRELWNLKMYGKSTQVTTTGKNLVNGYDNFTPLESGTYYLSTNTLSTTSRIDFGLYDENQELIRENIVSFVGSQFYLQSNGTYRLSNNANVIKSKITFDDERVKFIKIIFSNLYIKFDEIQLEQGDEPTLYEPYTGGQPSPSPQYPQPITAISKFDGVIRNSNQLFDASKIPTKSQGGATVTNNGDGSFTISGSGTTTALYSNYYDYSHEETLKLLKEGDLSIKSNAYGNPYFYVQLRSGSSPLLSIDLLNTTQVKKTITSQIINDPQLYMRIGFSLPSGREITQTMIKPTVYQDSDGTWQPFDSNPQEFTYIPSKNMYSTQDGSICDYVDVENGVWVYNLKPITFNGSEEWKTYNNPSSDTCISFTLLYNEKWVSNKFMCNAFEIQISVSDSEGIACFNATICQFVITIQKSRLSTLDVDGFKQWLSTNNVNVVIRLATPTEIPIDPEQLAMLKALYTYTGVTNFLCNALVSFTCERSLQIVINNLENAIGQTNANILLGGNQ